MTPKEKAVELYNYYEQLIRDHTRGVSIKELAKQCTLTAVNEMIKHAGFIWGGTRIGLSARDLYIKYWEEVKQEIENL